MRDQVIISKGIDWITIWLYFIFVSIGLLCIFSVEYHQSENILQNIVGLKKNYSRQLLFFGISAVVAILILLTDSKFFTATANISYVLGIILMMATFVVGKDINGSRSWIPMGFFNLQPVETCKIFTALALSYPLAANCCSNYFNSRSVFYFTE
jgi:rod shape determining protein RodA